MMSDRSCDWLNQRLRDLEQARDSRRAERHEWACFAAHQAAEKAVKDRQDVLKIGYFGSYARGDWGVESDLDLIIIVENCGQSFLRHSTGWDITD